MSWKMSSLGTFIWNTVFGQLYFSAFNFVYFLHCQVNITLSDVLMGFRVCLTYCFKVIAEKGWEFIHSFNEHWEMQDYKNMFLDLRKHNMKYTYHFPILPFPFLFHPWLVLDSVNWHLAQFKSGFIPDQQESLLLFLTVSPLPRH